MKLLAMAIEHVLYVPSCMSKFNRQTCDQMGSRFQTISQIKSRCVCETLCPLVGYLT